MDINGYKMDISNKLKFSADFFQQILQQLSIVDSFKGSWNTIELQQSKHLKELKKNATIESIGSSTRIEGSTLTDTEVEKLLQKVKITKLKTREQEEVIGYYDALQVILDNYTTIQPTENYIHQLYSILLKHSSKDQRHKGKYKILSNKVVATYPNGTQRTIFETTEPHLTAFEMANLLQWVKQRFEKNDMHTLLVIAVFVYEFLSIHPYQDGKGRLSRLLTTLLMLKNDYKFIQYVSFENLIELKKDAYYRALMNGQKNRGKTIEKLDQWILFFMECMVALTQRLQTKYNTYSQLLNTVNERQQKIINLFKKKKTAQVNDIVEVLQQYSRNTIKKDIALLVNEGILTRIGTIGRAVTYTINYNTTPKTALK
jgi:Fic family protein